MITEELYGKLTYLRHMREVIKKEQERLDLIDRNIQACMLSLKDKFCNDKHDWHSYGDYYSKWKICKKCGLET